MELGLIIQFMSLSLFGVFIVCYFVCWYCKKLGRRQAERLHRVNSINIENAPPVLSPSIRFTPVAPNSVDNFLETLIISYRNRPDRNRSSSAQNPNRTNLLNSAVPNSPLPRYFDALMMPKPQPQHEGEESNESISTENALININETENSAGESNGFVVMRRENDDALPSYEQAIKNMYS